MTYSWQLPNWPNFQVDTDSLIDDVAKYHASCSDASKEYGLLNKDAQHETLLEWLISEAISTSAIEGENLNREDVRSSILNHLGLHNPPLRVGDAKAEGVAALVLDVRKNASRPLSAEILCQWQGMVVQPAPYLPTPLIIGDFRQSAQPMQIVSGPMGYEAVHYEAPPSSDVSEEIGKFLTWYNDTTPTVGAPKKIPGLIRAAIAHAWLELIHPFDDGNGRVGRAVAEHAISQDTRSTPLFSLSAAIEENKSAYYEKLASVNRSLDFTEWVAWFIQVAYQAQINAQQQIAFTLIKTRFWDCFGDAALNDRQTKALNRMFQAGPASFEGGMTTKKYTNLTGASRATATRDLTDLVTRGAMLSTGLGRAVSYKLKLREQTQDPLEKMLTPAVMVTQKTPKTGSKDKK